MKRQIYLDNAATTKVRKEVAKAVNSYLTEEYGNPSSLHEMGERARKAIDKARSDIARIINAKPHEIIFTSGGTESNNLAIQGIGRKFPAKKTILISAIEHPSIFEVCSYLQKKGYRIIKIPVDKEGIININYLEKEIKKNKDILLVSIMHVNNIIGTIEDIERIGKLCRENNVIFHTDAVQGFGKIDLNVKKMNIDLLSASGHKIGSPKGVGFLYVREGIEISPLVFGGGQERGLRSGTENVPAIVGFAKALEFKQNSKRIEKMRNRLIEKIKNIEGRINGSIEKRIYNNVHASFNGIEGDVLVTFLSKKGIYVSAGSACDSKKEKDDHVLRAIGLNRNEKDGSVRITINEDINEKDIDYIAREIGRAIKVLKL